MRRPARLSQRAPVAGLIVAMALSGTAAFAQTHVTPPKNKFSPEEDVKIGREAAEEVRREFPIIEDARIDGYLDELGQRLLAAAPAELKQPVFEYSFTPVNLKDINAFALPGGPMFVNRGMVDAAGSEGEVAGVMAHELSHVLLRHGTANATKAQGFQLGALAGAIAGAVVGGGWGQAIAQGSQFGLGTWLLKYSREYEQQADLLGAQIMARAGYDPLDLARMFETIQQQGDGAPPQWLSSHPDPGNRSQYIADEARQLTVGRRPDETGFEQVKQLFASLPPARSMADLARSGNDSDGAAAGSTGTIGEPVPSPSSTFRTARGGQLFQVSVPTNWLTVSTNNAMKFVPPNAYGEARGQTVMTHGAELGVAPASSRSLQRATETLVEGFMRGNPDLRLTGPQTTVGMAGRNSLVTPLLGRSALGGSERVDLYTTFLADGNLFYLVTVAPDAEGRTYDRVFDRIRQSVRLRDQ